MEEQSKMSVVIVFGVVAAIVLGAKFVVMPILADVHFRKGLRAAKNIEYTKAETEFKVALNYRMEPAYLENIARLYIEMGQSVRDRNKSNRYYELAIYYYKKFIDLKPNSAMAYNGLGSCCLYMGRDSKDEEFYRSAIENFQQAIKLQPKFVDAHVNLATAYYLWGLKDRAISTYKQGIKDNPDSLSIHFNLGMLYYLEKKYKEAEEEWKKALAIDPENLDAQKGLKMIEKQNAGKR